MVFSSSSASLFRQMAPVFSGAGFWRRRRPFSKDFSSQRREGIGEILFSRVARPWRGDLLVTTHSMVMQ